MEYDVDRSIAAPADRIWSILTDAAGYTGWDNGVERVEGEIVDGGKITIHAEGMDRAFPTKVSDVEANRRMVWTGGMPLGLFTGVRTFTLTENPNGTTDFRMHEVFSGLLSPMITKKMPDLTPFFHQFADGLKAAAESTG